MNADDNDLQKIEEFFDYSWPLTEDEDEYFNLNNVCEIPNVIGSHNKKKNERKKRNIKSQIYSTDFNPLLLELDAQKQISSYWKDRFMDAFKDYKSAFPVNLLDIDVEKFHYDHKKTILNEIESENTPIKQMEFDIDLVQKAVNNYLDYLKYGTPSFVFNFSIDLLKVAWNSSRKDFHSYSDINDLLSLFEHCVVATGALQSVAEPLYMNRFLMRSIDLLQLLFFFHEIQCIKYYSQRVVNILLIFYYYYVSDDLEVSSQSILALAFQVISIHKDNILDETVLRLRLYIENFKDNANENYANDIFMFSVDHQQSDGDSVNQLSDIFLRLHPKYVVDKIVDDLPIDISKSLLERLEKYEKSLKYNASSISECFKNNVLMLTNAFMAELNYYLGNIHELEKNMRFNVDLAKKTECWTVMMSVAMKITLITAAHMKHEEFVHEGVGAIEKYMCTFRMLERHKEIVMDIFEGKTCQIKISE